MRSEIIEQIKQIPGVKEIYPAGQESVVIVFNPCTPVQSGESVQSGTGGESAYEPGTVVHTNKKENDYRKD